MNNAPEKDFENTRVDARAAPPLSELFPHVDALGFDTRSNTTRSPTSGWSSARSTSTRRSRPATSTERANATGRGT